jgi:gliding motility-associated-like protein
MSMISKFSTKGKYYIIRTNSFGCTDTTIVEVDNRCACTVNRNIISLNNNQFCKDQGNLRINGLSAIPFPGTYSWQTSRDSATWVSAKGGNSGIFYEISIIDFPIGRHYFRRIYTITSEGCFDTSNVISINILDAPSGGVNRSVLCWNKEFTNFTGAPGAGYRWEFLFSDPPGRTARILDPNLSTSRIDSFSGPARYTFRWTNGICESNVVVTALDLCDISCNINITGNRISPDTISECEKLQNFFFNGPTSSPTGGSYMWQVKQNGVYVDAPGQNTIEDYKPQILPVGQYSFRRLYQFGVCADTSNEIVVNILSTPTMPIISGPATVCEGSPISLSTPLVSGNSYRWSGPNGFISTQASLVIPNASILSNGEYRLIAGKGGCFSDTTRLNIKVIPRPKIPTAVSNLPICDGQELVISVTNKQNGITYSISNNFNEIRNDTIYRKQNASMNDEGNYTILADSVGCKSLPIVLNVKLNRPPIATIDKATIRCNEVDSVRLNVNETTGTWTASPSNPGTAIIGSGNNPVVKGFSTGGTYRFIWNNGGCTATVSVDVGISCKCIFPENVLIQPSPDFICIPTDTIVIRGRGATNTTVNYKWQSTSDSLFSLASGTNNLKDYSPGLINKGARFRRIMFLNSDSLCTDTSNVVFINFLDIKSIRPQLSVFNIPICEGDTAQIRWLDPIPFVKFKWTVSGNLTLTTIDTLPSIKVRAQSGGIGRVSLSINDKTCNGVILDSQIVVGKIPQIYLGEDTTICSLDQTVNKYELKIDSFQNILWSTGSTSQKIIVDNEGTYSVTVKNAEGCEATDSITIVDFCCKIRYPNIIKLSSNNQNNSFNIDHTECVESSKLRIYDRWGNLIFQSNDVNDKWDGSYNGNAVEQGVYVFIFEYAYTDTNGLKANGKVTGDITVIR